MMKKLSVFLLFVTLVFAKDIPAEEPESDDGSLRLAAKLLNDCSQKDDMAICFKMKAVNFMGRLLRTPNALPITDSIALARSSSATPDEINQTESFNNEQDLEASLPRSLDKRNEKLDEMMWNMFKNLFSTRTLQFTPSNEVEGRRKKYGGKKNGGMMMMMAMFFGMMMKLAMGKIALLAGKALVVAKIALVLAAIIGLKKLSSGGHESPQVVYATAEHGGSGGGWHRRFNTDPQNLAYGAHKE